MKISCPISGEDLYKSDLLLGFDLSDFHPIFKAKKSLILTSDMIHRFQSAKSYREKKLYFLAALNTTDLVDWRSAAQPSTYIMEHCYFDTLTLASWIDYARSKLVGRDKIQFPRYAVTSDNKELTSLPVWLGHLYDIRQVFLDKSVEEDVRRDLNNKLQTLENEFRKAGLTGRAFTAPLARWALDLTGTTSGVYESWLKLLCTPLEDAWMLDKEALVEIQEHLQAELPVNNDQAIAVLHQINKLVEECRHGFSKPSWDERKAARAFQFDDDGNQIFPSGEVVQQVEKEIRKEISGETYDVLRELGAAVHEINNLPPLPPAPNKRDFPKQFQYFQAKARWELEVQKRRPTDGEFKQF